MFRKYNPGIGARPGTLAIPPGSPFPKITVVDFDANTVNRVEIVDVEELRAIKETSRTTWVDIQGLGDEATIRAVGEIFGLHSVALENAVNVPQRAKTELYERHQLVIARAPVVDEHNVVHTPQVCFIIGERFVLSFQERSRGFFGAIRERIQAGLGPLRKQGAGYLAYALIDAMVDRYYPVAQQLAENLEELEDFIVDNPHPTVLARIQMLRRQLVVLRRVGWPQREAINAMLREQTPYIGDFEKVYLRDTHDHIAQIVELIDSSREMASDLADAYLSNVSHRTNEIMKVLTLMASIFIPLTFIAGIYGMNFENMPELRTRNGYYVVWGVMAVGAIAMVVYFRRRGWIGTSRPPDFDADREES